MCSNLTHKYRRETRAKRHFLLFIFVILLFLASISTSYASGIDAAWHTYTVGAGIILQRVALAGGAVGLAWCGIEYAYGSEESSRKAKAKALVILVAAAALYALPLVIKFGQSIGSQYKWDPSTLG